MPSPLPRWFSERVAPASDTDDLRVSTIELFFDLVFVFTATQLTHVLLHDFASGALQAVLMLSVIWYMYAAYAWATNAVPPVRAARRILLLAAMAAWLVVAMAVPDAFHGAGIWFAGGLIAVIIIHGLMYLQSTSRILPFLSCNLGGASLILVAGFLHGPLQYVAWAVGLLVMWLAPLVTGQGGFPLHPGHITERHSLVVIVALGESIVAVGAGAGEVELGWQVVAVAVLGLTLSACLWWAYFTVDVVRAEHALAECVDQVRRTRMVLLGFFFGHLPILLGIVGVAAGVSVAIKAGGEPLTGGPQLSLSIGVALFLLGSLLFSAAMGQPVSVIRAVAIVAIGCVIPLGAIAAVLQLAVIVCLLVATLVGETVLHRKATPVVTG